VAEIRPVQQNLNSTATKWQPGPKSEGRQPKLKMMMTFTRRAMVSEEGREGGLRGDRDGD
jgi:hypothetical protein